MAPEDRRAAVLDAAIPLLRERGPGVTTRELADAAGVAEGTLFRVFADKAAIVDAALERALDPEPVVAELITMDRSDLHGLLAGVIDVIGTRARDAAALVAVSMQVRAVECAPPRAPHRHRHPHLEAVVTAVTDLLRPHTERLRRPPEVCARTLVGVVLTASGPMARDLRLDIGDVTALLVDGMVEHRC